MQEFSVYVCGDDANFSARIAVESALAKANLNPVVHAASGDAQEILITIPDPDPTIPELIAKWHAVPVFENRKPLWEALNEGGFRYGAGLSFQIDTGLYAAIPHVFGQSGLYMIVCR